LTQQSQDTGKRPASPEKNDPDRGRGVGEDGKPPRKIVELASVSTPEHPILPGGMKSMKSMKKFLMGETSQGSDDALRDQAHLHYEQHEYDNAKQLYEDVLANNKWKSGRNPRETAMAMTNLATIYTMQRNFQQATLWYQRALPIYERELGLDHRRTAEVRAKLSLGQQLGSYLLVNFLGQGGFANVYLGEHAHLPNRRAAVKMLKQVHLVDQNDKDEFYKEAQTLFDLKHPHIVRVQDFGVKGGVPYLVMEYAPNGTLLDAHPHGTPLPFREVVAYVDRIADALQYLHDRKFMHLDLKPENVLL
jgi:tetratricopeptide (TPR) repeat protein